MDRFKKVFCMLPVLAAIMQAPCAYADEVIPNGAKVFVVEEPSGFHTYLISAISKKKVPVSVVTDRSLADYEIKTVSDSQKASAVRTIFTGQTGSREEAAMNVINLKTSAIAFAYNVNKGNSAKGKQSAAESCAKHLKEKIESRK